MRYYPEQKKESDERRNFQQSEKGRIEISNFEETSFSSSIPQPRLRILYVSFQFDDIFKNEGSVSICNFFFRYASKFNILNGSVTIQSPTEKLKFRTK